MKLLLPVTDELLFRIGIFALIMAFVALIVFFLVCRMRYSKLESIMISEYGEPRKKGSVFDALKRFGGKSWQK